MTGTDIYSVSEPVRSTGRFKHYNFSWRYYQYIAKAVPLHATRRLGGEDL
jgi:hypothetical protein